MWPSRLGCLLLATSSCDNPESDVMYYKGRDSHRLYGPRFVFACQHAIATAKSAQLQVVDVMCQTSRPGSASPQPQALGGRPSQPLSVPEQPNFRAAQWVVFV